MSSAVYWVWLQKAMGAGARLDDLLAAFPTARALYDSSDMDRRLSGVLTAKQLDRLSRTPLSQAQSVVQRCGALGQRIVTPEDDDYPAALRTLPDLPAALYVRGDLSCLQNRLAIAVVGSRSASLHSLGVARQLSRDLARAGVTVVSGCALGVDSASHTGALAGNGRTVGVLGCGLDVSYLKGYAALREEIVQSGALLTEYTPGSGAYAAHFPMRNRIISGLSSGVVVIEAGENSGSLITARCAAEQGRDVFGVPGDVTSLHFTGVHRLIRDGARAVFSARDILQEYTWVYDDLRLDELADRLTPPEPQAPVRSAPPAAKPKARKPLPDGISADARKVYDMMHDQALYTDDLVRATQLEPNRVFTALTELEIYGLIQMTEGKRYRIKDENE